MPAPGVKAVPAEQTQAEGTSLPNHRGSSLAQPPAAWQKDFSFFRASEGSQQPSGAVTKVMALSGLEKRHKENLL